MVVAARVFGDQEGSAAAVFLAFQAPVPVNSASILRATAAFTGRGR